MSNSNPRVIILGAGPIGLAASLELARQGVPSIVIERNSSTSWHPKTRNFCTRSMEIARGWGRATYDRLRAVDTPDGWKSPIRFLQSAVGEEYAFIESKGFEGPGPDASPALPIMSSQDRIEEILVDAARESGLVELCFDTEAIRLVEGEKDDATRAVLEVRRKGQKETELVIGSALVAADGAQSLIRQQLGIELEGAKGLQHLINTYFHADIESRVGDRTGVLLFVGNPKASGVLQALDAKGRWLCQIKVDEEEWSADVFTKPRAEQWVRDAVGDQDLDVNVLSVGFWKLNATVAEHLVQGRVVLCGDAAHQFPPTGGLGVNVGLMGMHNAMWKLAYFVRGDAGWDLVETYNTERRPVAARVTAQSLQNSINVNRIFAAQLGQIESGLSVDEVVTESRRYGNHLGVEFGAVYESSAVVSDGTSAPEVADDYSDYVPSATPGCRAPNVWLGNVDRRVASIDLFGRHFVLLAGPEGSAWCEEADAASRELGIIIPRHRVGDAGIEDLGGFLEAYEIGAEGAVLVRPDGYVAWRSAGAGTEKGELTKVLTGILAV